MYTNTFRERYEHEPQNIHAYEHGRNPIIALDADDSTEAFPDKILAKETTELIEVGRIYS